MLGRVGVPHSGTRLVDCGEGLLPPWGRLHPRRSILQHQHRRNGHQQYLRGKRKKKEMEMLEGDVLEMGGGERWIYLSGEKVS